MQADRFTIKSQEAISAAGSLAERRRNPQVTPEHLLLALAAHPSKAGDALRAHGATEKALAQAIAEVRGPHRVTDQSAEDKYQALEKFGRDLTAEAETGKLDPVIGRDDEIRRVIQVLSRRTKNNPVLIGEPGVGKTAIVEGLAQRIVSGDVPEGLRDRRLVALDIGAMVAGSKYRGEFEDRLKPMLARGELRCVGATTLDEYRKHIEKDAALERRFQPVYVDEPSVEDTIAILRGLKERYEVHHGVRIQDSAIIAAATLSQRYIADRFLPDKAIDLIDEAASRLRIEIDSMPTEIDEVERRIQQLEIELQALKKEKDEASEAIRETKGRLEQAHREAERGERDADLQRAAELRYGEIPELERTVREQEARLSELQTTGTMLKEEVDDEDVAEVVAKWTGIPVSKLMEGEVEKLVHMEERLHERVIGQDEAVAAVSNALRRSRAGLQDENRPIGTFLFMGPTGVGKTELARALAEFMFDSEQAMVRIDMSEYMEKHAVARLIGAPPGYVGYDEGGQLTEAVRRRPYSVVLLDEVEKAHTDVFNILLQVLDDGRLTDGQGRTVDFKNTVLIMTSNIPGGRAGAEATFKPEFINRLDDIVEFESLDRSQIGAIVDLQVERLVRRVHERGIDVELTDGARMLLGNLGYDPTYGARPLKRVIQKHLVDPLALAILEGDFREGDVVRVDPGDGQIVLSKAEVAEPVAAA